MAATLCVALLLAASGAPSASGAVGEKGLQEQTAQTSTDGGAEAQSEPSAQSSDGADPQGKAAHQSLKAGVERGVEAPERLYRVSAYVEHARPVLVDDDPENDLSTVFAATGSYRLIDGGWAKLNVGTTLRHSYDPGESAFDLRDVVGTFQYTHGVGLEEFSLGKRELSLRHSANVYFPTSKLSRAQDKYFSLRGTTEASTRLIDDLYIGLDLLGQYNSHQYERAAGPGGRPYTAFVLQLGGSTEYVMELPIGSLSAGAWVGQYWSFKYVRGPVQPAFGYDLYVSYTPFYHLTASVSLAHEVARRRADGAVQNDDDLLFDRDATAFVFRLIGRY